MRNASLPVRMTSAALLALLLALRLLNPAGFMPAFDHGAVSIVACPDYDPAPAPMAHHHRHNGAKHEHQPCPYAAGAAAGTQLDSFLFAFTFLFAGTLLLWGSHEFPQSRRSGERPPLRGPPLTA